MHSQKGVVRKDGSSKNATPSRHWIDDERGNNRGRPCTERQPGGEVVVNNSRTKAKTKKGDKRKGIFTRLTSECQVDPHIEGLQAGGDHRRRMRTTVSRLTTSLSAPTSLLRCGVAQAALGREQLTPTSAGTMKLRGSRRGSKCSVATAMPLESANRVRHLTCVRGVRARCMRLRAAQGEVRSAQRAAWHAGRQEGSSGEERRKPSPSRRLPAPPSQSSAFFAPSPRPNMHGTSAAQSRGWRAPWRRWRRP